MLQRPHVPQSALYLLYHLSALFQGCLDLLLLLDLLLAPGVVAKPPELLLKSFFVHHVAG